MRLTLKQLQRLSVETISGVKLGKVHDVVFEIDGQMIVQYVVKPSILSREAYLVSRDQVIRFEKDKMIVDDAVRREVAEKTVRGVGVLPDAEPIAMSDTGN